MIGAFGLLAFKPYEILDKLYRFKDENILMPLFFHTVTAITRKKLKTTLWQILGKVRQYSTMSHDDYIRY